MGGKKRKRSGKRLSLALFLVALVAIVAIAFLLHSERKQEAVKKPPPSKKKEIPRQGPVRDPVADIINRHEASPAPLPRESEKRQVAIIIDDLGGDLASVRELLKLDTALTFAVLPFTAHAAEAARMIHGAGREVLLHLPLEPLRYPQQNPGEGTLLVGMSRAGLKSQLEKDLDAVPHISGVNNHMGSRFMEDEEKVALMLRQIKARGLFFVDSRTTAQTKGPELAARVGIPFAERRVFIDNAGGYEDTLRNLTHLADVPKDKVAAGPVVLIGHPHPSTIRALKDALPKLKEKGIQIVPVSQITRSSGNGPRSGLSKNN